MKVEIVEARNTHAQTMRARITYARIMSSHERKMHVIPANVEGKHLKAVLLNRSTNA